MNLQRQPFGHSQDGTPVDLFTLSNADGLSARITNYGGIVVALCVPDRHGTPADVVLGFDTLAPYLVRHPFFGALVGRIANRTGGARFTLDGVEYRLAQNDGENHSHGGFRGFDKVIWQPATSEGPEGAALALTYLSHDGEEGYPGNLSVQVTYTVTPDDCFRIAYHAVTDKPTVINMTNHSYFNLAGAGSGTILDHIAQIDADCFTAIDENRVATGELLPVSGTAMDFRQPRRIGLHINDDDEQLRRAIGFDLNWVFNKAPGTYGKVIELYEPGSGRRLEVFTTQPGVQFYTGNKLTGAFAGKGGIAYHKQFGVCLETQHFPNSANRPSFPSIVLRPGEQYDETTVYKFSTR